MLIGELAEIVGLPAQTIRYYERRGLLPYPLRESNGYRNYGEAAIRRLRFVRAAQAAGLTLDEIRSIVQLRETGDLPCVHVSALLDQKLIVIRRSQRELAVLASEIEQLIDASARLNPAECANADVCQIISAHPAPPISV